MLPSVRKSVPSLPEDYRALVEHQGSGLLRKIGRQREEVKTVSLLKQSAFRNTKSGRYGDLTGYDHIDNWRKLLAHAVEKGVFQDSEENENVVRLPYQMAAAAAGANPAPAPRVVFSADAIAYLRTLHLGFAAKTFFNSLGFDLVTAH